jgi:glycogen debranching enzyme
MFANTGRRIYVLGDIDGGFRPRSNPYDLHEFGRPDPNDPLAGKLQGVWAQPVKGMAGYGYTLSVKGEPWTLLDAVTFTQTYAFVELEHRRGSLLALRRDFTALEEPLLFTTLRLKNEEPAPLDIEVRLAVEFDLQDAWFTHLADWRNTGQAVAVEGSRLVARAEVLPEQWAAAAGCLTAAGCRSSARAALLGTDAGELAVPLRLEPGAEAELVFAMAVVSQGGTEAALALVEGGLARHAALLEEKIAAYEAVRAAAPRLVSPEEELNQAFEIALANLGVLEASGPRLGSYFIAGLEMFPFWFSNDGAYSVPGLMAGGFSVQALNHITIGLQHLGAGRVPHQISPSGNVAFAGNAQETPLWVMSIWDAYRWCGDRDFLARLYPGALMGMYDYVLGTIDPDGDGYASGPGMVEVEGMGPEKLDTAAYTWVALLALAEMAGVLGDDPNAVLARSRADDLAARFDADWWDEDSGAYAMSLADPGNARLPVPHWAVIVPLEVGLAPEAHAAVTFSTLRRDYLNRWGLKHTVGSDERVWTLPTATLSRAAYRYGEVDLGGAMLRRLADTLEHGSIGLFHELIPEGACIVQLWSAATFLRGVVEDLLGIEVDAARHALRITPHLPREWGSARLENLCFGQHRVSLRFEPGGIQIEHRSGSSPLAVEVVFPSGTRATGVVEPGMSSEL